MGIKDKNVKILIKIDHTALILQKTMRNLVCSFIS